MKIAFHSSYLGYRGTEVALMDYAWGNQAILSNESFFLMPWRELGEGHPVAKKMRDIARLRFYRTSEEREGILAEEKADLFFCIKNGFNDGVFSRRVSTGIQAIFRESEYHGDVYAYISQWLSDVMTYGKAAVAPWMIRLDENQENLRTELGISPEVCVYGRYGGDDSFDIPWVQQVVVETARKNSAICFIFMNTREFPGTEGVPNIYFLPATSDPIRKRAFINTCDAMIHGRQRGETLGLACLEFASTGRKVLTYSGSPELAHLGILGEAGLPFADERELRELLVRPADSFRHEQNFEHFSPKPVMRQFQRVFLGI